MAHCFYEWFWATAAYVFLGMKGRLLLDVLCQIAAVLLILQFLFDVLGWRTVGYSYSFFSQLCKQRLYCCLYCCVQYHPSTAYEHFLNFIIEPEELSCDQTHLYLSFSVLLELRMFQVCRRMKHGKLMCASMVVILNRVIYVEQWKRLMFH